MLLHGVGHHWQAWEPVIERLVGEFDVIACDSPGFGRSAPLPPVDRADDPRLRRRVRVVLRGARPRAPARRRQLDGRRDRARARARPRGPLGQRLLAGGLLDAAPSCASASSRCGALGARCPRRARPAIEALARTRARARRRCSRRRSATPRACRAEEAVATLSDAWAAPAFARRSRRVPPLPLRRARAAAQHARDDRVGQARPAAPLPAAGAASARDAAVGDARDARRRARAVLRRSRRRRRRDPHARSRARAASRSASLTRVSRRRSPASRCASVSEPWSRPSGRRRRTGPPGARHER